MAAIPIPTELRRPHPLVTATQQAASGLKPRDDGRLEIGSKKGIAHLVVSREHLRRALLVLQAIAAEAVRRGHTLRAVDKSDYGERAGVAVVVGGHEYTVEIQEITDRVPLTDAERAEWERTNNRHRFEWEKEATPPKSKGVPNGRLRISLPSRWGGARCNWGEGPRASLEEQLVLLFAEIERRAEEDDQRAEERLREQAERQRQQVARQEREQLERIEKARLSRLRTEIDVWRLAAEARDYVAALRVRLPELAEADRQRIAAWCDWADAWSARADPIVATDKIRGLDDERDRFFTPPR